METFGKNKLITPPRADGVTLVELIIAITVLSVVLTIGLPSMTTYVQDNRILAESNRIIANLNFARSEASSRATSITMSRKSGANNDWSEGWTMYTDADAGGNSVFVGGVDFLLRDVEAAPAMITVNSNNSGTSWISYQPSGMLNEGGNTVVIAICDDRGEAEGRDITINLAGRVSVDTPSADCTP